MKNKAQLRPYLLVAFFNNYNNKLFLTVLEAKKSKIGMPADSVSSEGLLPDP